MTLLIYNLIKEKLTKRQRWHKNYVRRSSGFDVTLSKSCWWQRLVHLLKSFRYVYLRMTYTDQGRKNETLWLATLYCRKSQLIRLVIPCNLTLSSLQQRAMCCELAVVITTTRQRIFLWSALTVFPLFIFAWK